MGRRSDAVIESHLYLQSFNNTKAKYKSASGVLAEDFADIVIVGFWPRSKQM